MKKIEFLGEQNDVLQLIHEFLTFSEDNKSKIFARNFNKKNYCLII